MESLTTLFRSCACETDLHEDMLIAPRGQVISKDMSDTRPMDQVMNHLVVMHYNMGCSLQEEGKLNEAIVCYQNALALDQNYCDAQYNLANALQLSGRITDAEIEYIKTIALNPRHQLAYYNLGYIYFNDLKDPWKGIEMLKKSLEIDPTDVDAQINMALALNDLGMINDVINCYRYIIERNKSCVMAYFNLGNAYLDSGRTEEALQSFQVPPHLTHMSYLIW
jgi:tetratricopeptide (TPR) repeat protein